MNFDPTQNLPAHSSPFSSNPTPQLQNPNLAAQEAFPEPSQKMEIEPSPQKISLPKFDADVTGKQSPMTLIKASPGKQEVSTFNQPEEHITIIFSSFKDAIRNADIPRLKEILQKYQDRYDLTNRLDPVTKHISTFLASEIKDDSKCYEVLSLLLKYRANAHFIDNMKQNVLFYLSKEGHCKCIDLILSKGLNPEDSDTHGQTPIYYASRDGRADVIKLLIQRGADVNHKDNISNQTCLFYAARDGRYEACKAILENGGLASHMDNKKQTPLHWAKRHNKKEVIELLQAYSNTKHEGKGEKVKTKATKAAAPAQLQAPLPVANVNVETPYIEPSNETIEAVPKEEPQLPLPLPMMNAAPSEEKISMTMVMNSSNSASNNLLKKRKREKYEAKISYKLVYTDDFGKSSELTNADFEKFKEKYPQIAEMILRADSLINENIIKENKEKETWEKVAKRILNNVWKLKGAFYFHSPVDPVRLKIDDYFEIIKKPMDFGTIKSKLNTNVYKEVQEFLSDMNLVFHNCVLYNGSESEVGKVGLAIQREFENMVKSQQLLAISEERKDGTGKSSEGFRREDGSMGNVV